MDEEHAKINWRRLRRNSRNFQRQGRRTQISNIRSSRRPSKKRIRYDKDHTRRGDQDRSQATLGANKKQKVSLQLNVGAFIYSNTCIGAKG